MASHAGKEGTVKLGSNAVAEVTEWSITTSGDVAEDTSIDNTDGWRTYKSTFNSWAGSLTCHWDESDTNGQEALDIGGSVTLNVYPEGDSSGDVYFSGTAIVTGIERSADINGIVGAQFSFQGTGALTQSAVA